MQNHPPRLLFNAFQGHFFISHQCHNNLPVPGTVTLFNNHVVTVEDAFVDHRIPTHAQHVAGPATQQFVGHLQGFRLRYGFDGAAGCDCAEEGDALLLLRLFDQADAAVAAVHGFDQTGLDEGLDVFVQGAA